MPIARRVPSFDAASRGPMGPHGILLFVHIPKTGGTTFSKLLRRQFPPHEILWLDGHAAQHATTLAGLSAEQRRRLRCIYGHIDWGIDRGLDRAARYVTFLRHPVDRLVSAYYFALRRPEWGDHQPITEQRLSLHDFVTSPYAQWLHNGQTFALSGGDAWRGGTHDRLEQARAHLEEKGTFVGLTERFDESVLLCGARFGWADVRYGRVNVNRQRPALATVAAHTRAAIARANRQDLELYEIATRRLAERWRNAGPDITTQLAPFRRRNALYNLTW